MRTSPSRSPFLFFDVNMKLFVAKSGKRAEKVAKKSKKIPPAY
jgi:hypothetical protein